MLRCWMFSCSSTHTSCYAAGCSLAVPHIRHATLLDVFLHFHTYVMLRCWMFSCTSIHTSCYAAGCSLAHPYIRHATLLHVLLHFHTYVMLRCCTFSCTSTHTSCYAAARPSCTSTHTSCYAAARPLALPHIRHATLQNSSAMHWYVQICKAAGKFSCTSKHTSAMKNTCKCPHRRHAHNRGDVLWSLAGTQTSCYDCWDVL